jgi:cytochrome c-type biogenesis protein CcmH/NrfG
VAGAGAAGVAVGVLLAILLTREPDDEPPPQALSGPLPKVAPQPPVEPPAGKTESPQAKPPARGDAAEEKKAPPGQEKPPPEPAKKGPDLERLLRDGLTALKARQYESAVKAFHAAATLSPGHEDALAGLGMAQRALAEHEQQTTFRTLLDAGLANLASKQFDAAVVALDEALKLRPGDPEAVAARQRAETGRAASKAALAQADFQKKAEQYQKWMTEGRTLFTTGDYTAAVAAFAQAQQLFPGDRASAQLREQAEQARAQQAAEAGQPRDDARTRKLVRGLLAAALRAQSDRNWKVAERALEEAWKLAPDDPAVRAALRDLEQQRQLASLEQDGRWTAYYQAMKWGRDAVAAGRLVGAVKEFTRAVQLVQGDPDALSLRRVAERERDTALAALNVERQRDERLRQLVTEGRRALAANQLPTATRALTTARKLAPEHPLVEQLAREIRNHESEPRFTLKVPKSLKLAPGGKAKLTVTIERQGKGPAAQIELKVKGKLPSGVTASMATFTARQGSVEIEFSAAPKTSASKGLDLQVVGVPRGGGPEVSSDRFRLTISKK